MKQAVEKTAFFRISRQTEFRDTVYIYVYMFGARRLALRDRVAEKIDARASRRSQIIELRVWISPSHDSTQNDSGDYAIEIYFEIYFQYIARER